MGKAKRLKKIRESKDRLLQSGAYKNGETKHKKKIVGINPDGTLKISQAVTDYSAARLAKRDAKKIL